ncbi:ArgS-related anticodon-binding protein NrtL [Streptomyces sp. NPDC006527]|uniref:ArgS-related anticodon-binding protein NrtL n=1 Tax=Streptomyces sp. NPDC006527 TaxID=3364749 RepID=UPI00369149CE
MTPVELSRTVLHAVRRAVDAGDLAVAVPSRAVVAPPGPGGCGDYATNIALQLARPAGQPPLRVAEVLRPYLAGAVGVTGVEITGPGFLNISLDHTATSAALVRRILREGLRYGHGTTLAGQVFELRVPYDVRAEVLADALGRIVGTQGGRVEVDHREPVNLRPVPAPEDPAPLGLDAARWALLHPAPHDRPRITADHLIQREGNPLFRVRYAHARTRAICRNAADLGFTVEPGDPLVDQGNTAGFGDHCYTGDPADPGGHCYTADPADPGGHSYTGDPADPRGHSYTSGTTDCLTTPSSTAAPAAQATPNLEALPAIPRLTTLLADHPRILTTVAALPHPDGIAAPSRLTRHLVALADATLVLLPAVLPRGEEKPSAAHRARLALAEAAGTVLAGGLTLLGIDAPDHL